MNFERGLLRRMGLASTAIGALLYAVLPMAAPAQAGDDNMFSSVTNFFAAPFGGGKSATDNVDKGYIDYRPRPTLVVPPTYTLPPPQPTVARGADWPKDPDGVALQKAKADSRRPAPLVASAGGGSDTRVITSTGPLPQDKCTTFGMPVCMPWGKHDAESGKVVLRSSMPRKYLTDPPVGYTEAVEVPKKGQVLEKRQAKARGEDDSVTRKPPKIDYTPPGK